MSAPLPLRIKAAADYWLRLRLRYGHYYAAITAASGNTAASLSLRGYATMLPLFAIAAVDAAATPPAKRLCRLR